MAFSFRGDKRDYLMDVKDYSQKLDQARDKYRAAQEDLSSSYSKNTEDMKETHDRKIEKLGKNYGNQKSKLEEQNLVNNQLYSDKTKDVIAKNQEHFRNDIKKNTEKFDIDRNEMKSEFNDKLTNLSESYKKSTAENDRYHNQASKTMGDRYSKANQNYKSDYDKQIEGIDEKTKKQSLDLKADAKKERVSRDKEYQGNLENLRSSNQEQKFKEVSRLRNDNENLRTNFALEKDAMTEQKESRINDVLNLKSMESEEGQKNFSNLQNDIRKKSIVEEERVKVSHQGEAKALEEKFHDDLRTMQHFTNQKIRGGNEVSTLKDENKQLVTSYEDRLRAARSDAEKNMSNALEKEAENDSLNRERLKSIKSDNIEALDKKETSLTAQHKANFQQAKDKTNTLVDRYKTEIGSTKVDNEEKLSKADSKSKNQLKNQRVEFGKFINNVNDKKMEEITSIKSEYAKDKSNFIEKSKRDYSDEKVIMKDEFNRKDQIKEDLYERKLSEMEKQTNKIIENYESRINQIARKAEKEVDVLKATDEQRKTKEAHAQRIAVDSMQKEHKMELGNIRGKYEGMIGKDRIINEQQTNRLVQKYEDQLDRERTDHQKEISLRLNESQAQFERLFKATELEKETLRNQYEQRMENMKLASLSQGNSKKS